jgi:DNA replication and repair protein RecF
MELLTPFLAQAYRDVAGDDASVRFTYRASWGDGGLDTDSVGELTALLDGSLERSRRIDYERRMTTVGPHRDEPGFAITGADSRTRASQGEQRTIALAVKLATHRAVTELVGDEPVLLLDDVFSELDHDRSASLAKCLPPGTQTMITSARREDLPVDGRTWMVGEGEVR